MKRKWAYFVGLIVLGGFLLYGVSQYKESEERKPHGDDRRQLRNVYLITASGLRADHLSSYLYPHIQTPAIDFLAYDGARFTNAFTTSPSSLIAHLSVLSGLYPHHKSLQAVAESLLVKADSSAPLQGEMLPSLLAKAGYRTAAFLADPELRLNSFLMQMFQEVATGDSLQASWLPSYSSPVLVRLAREWMIRNQGRPQFLWLNFSEPTFPFKPPGPYDFQYANHPYDGEIAALDEQVGLLISLLKDLNLFQNSVTVFTAPYGESLLGTGRFYHPEKQSLRVPLLVAAPGLLERRQEVPTRASLVDIAPTVLSLLRVSSEMESDGVDLFSDQRKESRVALYGQNPFPALCGFPPEFLTHTARYLYYSDGVEELVPQLNLQPTDQLREEWIREARQFLRQAGFALSGNKGSQRVPHPALVVENALRLAQAGNPRWAIDFLEVFALNQQPTPYVALLLAELWNETGRPEAALERLSEGCRNPCSPPWMSLRSRTFLQNGQYEQALEAMEAYRQSLQYISYYDHHIMGMILLGLNRSADAIASFDAALHLNPRLSQAYTHRGTALEAENLTERAELDYRKAIEANPQEAPAYRRLAALLARKQLEGEAIPYLKKFLDFHPADYPAKLELAGLHTSSGNQQEARRLLQEVILYSSDPLLQTRAEEMISSAPPEEVEAQ